MLHLQDGNYWSSSCDFQEINEIELVRVEKENDGPHTEVRYWKKRMTRFNSLLEQLKSKDVSIVHTILKLANSGTLQVSTFNSTIE